MFIEKLHMPDSLITLEREKQGCHIFFLIGV